VSVGLLGSLGTGVEGPRAFPDEGNDDEGKGLNEGDSSDDKGISK